MSFQHMFEMIEDLKDTEPEIYSELMRMIKLGEELGLQSESEVKEKK